MEVEIGVMQYMEPPEMEEVRKGSLEPLEGL